MSKSKHPLKGRLVSADQAVATKSQHRKPCADCPFARTALKGWLGGTSIEEWLQKAGGEVIELCHCTTNQQCAGLAIFRANIFKSPRYKEILTLEPDRALVFANRQEFADHHRRDQ